jgi:hypothetical protein
MLVTRVGTNEDDSFALETASYTRAIGLLDGIKRLLSGAKADAEAVEDGEVPAATPQGEDERETSTNAQTAGASDEPWPGNDA